MNQQLRMPHRGTGPQLPHHDSAAPPYLQVYVLGTLGTSAWSLAPPSDDTAVGSGTAARRARARLGHTGPHRPRDDHPRLHPERRQARS